MYRFSFYHRLVLCSITFTLLLFTSSCSVDEAYPTGTSQQNDQSRIEIRTDLTAMAQEVRQEVANLLHVSVSNVTSCFFHAQTQQGYRYGYFLNSSPTNGGSYYLTGVTAGALQGFIVIEDVEGF